MRERNSVTFGSVPNRHNVRNLTGPTDGRRMIIRGATASRAPLESRTVWANSSWLAPSRRERRCFDHIRFHNGEVNGVRGEISASRASHSATSELSKSAAPICWTLYVDVSRRLPAAKPRSEVNVSVAMKQKAGVPGRVSFLKALCLDIERHERLKGK